MRLLVLIILLIIASCNDAGNSGARSSDSPITSKQSTESPGMRDPQPVIVDVPETKTDSSFLDDPNYFDIGIEKDSFVVNYKNRKTILYNFRQLDSMVDANDDGMMDGKVVLSAKNKDAYKRVNEIVKLLKSDSIRNFRLYSPLEKDPGLTK